MIPVWLIASTFEPRGRSLYTLRLAAHLADYGFDPLVICQSTSQVPQRYRPRFKIREVPWLTSRLFGGFVVRRLAEEYSQNPPALLHAQRRKLDEIALELADRFERPYLLTVHDVLPSGQTLAVL